MAEQTLQSAAAPRSVVEPAPVNTPLPRVGIVLLNFNNWGDTIECLESLLRLDYPDFEVLVCDNDSRDGSVEHIAAWARGDLCPLLRHRRVPSQRVASWPAALPCRVVVPDAPASRATSDPEKLFILPTGHNGGFSFGNNVGMRFTLLNPAVSLVWLLNNDTVVDPGSLLALVRRMLADPGIGICGSTLLDYAPPFNVQALGGARCNRWRGGACVIFPADYPGLAGVALAERVERDMDFVIGASMLVSRTFLDRIGLLSEQYFLYSEEPDWARRAQGQFRLGYCADSVVYHRLGSTTGDAARGFFGTYHLFRSRVIFVAKFDPWALPTMYLLCLLDVVKALLQRRFARTRGIVAGLFSVGLRELLALARSRPRGPDRVAPDGVKGCTGPTSK